MAFKDLEGKGVELEQTLRGEAGKTQTLQADVWIIVPGIQLRLHPYLWLLFMK